jgi:hypothetical protein
MFILVERIHKRKRSLQDSTIDLSKMRMALNRMNLVPTRSLTQFFSRWRRLLRLIRKKSPFSPRFGIWIVVKGQCWVCRRWVRRCSGQQGFLDRLIAQVDPETTRSRSQRSSVPSWSQTPGFRTDLHFIFRRPLVRPEVRFCLSDGQRWAFFILKSENWKPTYYESATRTLSREVLEGSDLPLRENVQLVCEWVSFSVGPRICFLWNDVNFFT